MSQNELPASRLHPAVYFAMALHPLVACWLSLGGYGAWVEHRVDTFCADLRPGGPADALPARARTEQLHFESSGPGFDRNGARYQDYLAYDQVGFLRWYCVVETRDGRVASAETGFAQGT